MTIQERIERLAQAAHAGYKNACGKAGWDAGVFDGPWDRLTDNAKEIQREIAGSVVDEVMRLIDEGEGP